jgi:hypothetical protein
MPEIAKWNVSRLNFHRGKLFVIAPMPECLASMTLDLNWPASLGNPARL